MSHSSRTASVERVKFACAKVPALLEGSQESIALTRQSSIGRRGSYQSLPLRSKPRDTSFDVRDSSLEHDSSWTLTNQEPSSEEPTQSSEPVPISSTPDLGSHSSSSSDSALRSAIVVTPLHDNFSRLLEQKLRALQHNLYSSPGQKLKPDEDSWSQESSSDEYETTPSVSESGRAMMKRKRAQSTNPGPGDNSFEASDITSQSSKKLKQTSIPYVATEKASARQAHGLLSACSSFASTTSTEPVTSSGATTPGVPIIAPPPFELIPRPLLNEDEYAEVRLQLLMRKEAVLRARDGFTAGISPVFDDVVPPEQVSEFLGIDATLRRSVIVWLLRIVPSRKAVGPDLYSQLRTCPETRFHAIQLFTRYFLRIGDIMRLWTREKETLLMKLGRERIVWSVAISCLALAVKFQRDFLSPLEPVHVSDFLTLTKEPMGHDDFEISQRDVLQVLDYEIRDVTPEPYMEELHACLPNLRKLLSFTGGWEEAKVNAWQLLNAAVVSTEFLQFPMYLLVASALAEGILDALAAAYEQEADLDDPMCSVTAIEDARTNSSGVLRDIRELMGISSAEMKQCRRWLIKNAEVA